MTTDYSDESLAALQRAVAARLVGDAFFAVFASALVDAYAAANAEFSSRQETAAYDSLVDLVAKHPLAPLGASASAVKDALDQLWREIVEPADDEEEAPRSASPLFVDGKCLLCGHADGDHELLVAGVWSCDDDGCEDNLDGCREDSPLLAGAAH